MSDLHSQGKIMIFIEKFPYFKCGNFPIGTSAARKKYLFY
jgi:hypothetical protein